MALVKFPSGAAARNEDPDDDRNDEEDGAGGKMSFLEHLDELRRRIIVSIYGLVGGCVVSFIFVNQTQRFILEPLQQMMPGGQRLVSVRGNCDSGNELSGCDAGSGPRSFLLVSARGDVRAASDALFAGLVAKGWKKDAAGLVANDHAAGDAVEDIAPVYCQDGSGCVGRFRYDESAGRYELGWWAPGPR